MAPHAHDFLSAIAVMLLPALRKPPTSRRSKIREGAIS